MKTIYGLIDPRTRGIRYVGEVRGIEGWTHNVNFFIKTRLDEVPLSKCGKWLTELREHEPSLAPEVVLLEQTAKSSAKLDWMRALLDAGADLVNTQGMAQLKGDKPLAGTVA